MAMGGQQIQKLALLNQLAKGPGGEPPQAPLHSPAPFWGGGDGGPIKA